MQLCSWEPLKVSHHSTKSVGHFGSGDIMVLFCHVISQKHLLDFMSRSPLRKITILQRLVAIANSVVEL